MRQPARPPGLPTRHARRDGDGSDQPQCRMAHDPVAHTAPRARPKVRRDHPRSPNRSASRRTAGALTEFSRSNRSPIRCQLWDTTRDRFSTIHLKESLTWEYLQFSSAPGIHTRLVRPLQRPREARTVVRSPRDPQIERTVRVMGEEICSLVRRVRFECSGRLVGASGPRRGSALRASFAISGSSKLAARNPGHTGASTNPSAIQADTPHPAASRTV